MEVGGWHVDNDNHAAPVGALEERSDVPHLTSRSRVVVLDHSVVIFAGWFIGWAWLLAKFDFAPGAVFLLFGATGTFAEMALNPSAALAGFRIFVYGIMVFLPAYTIPDPAHRRADGKPLRVPRWYHYLLAATVVPFVFMLPFGALHGMLALGHPPVALSAESVGVKKCLPPDLRRPDEVLEG